MMMVIMAVMLMMAINLMAMTDDGDEGGESEGDSGKTD